MDKFKGKYRILSARLRGWDYSNAGAYFITICTAGRECIFGKIIDDEMYLSEMGKIVLHEWDKSFEIRKELHCDNFVIMPNHIHAIVRIVETHGGASDQNNTNNQTHGGASINNNQSTHSGASNANNTIYQTHNRASLRQAKTGVAYRPPKSVSSFVAGFKSVATTRINKLRNTPGATVWQERFHDHVIRNDASYQRIYNYITTNPQNWEGDKFHPSKL